VVVHKFHRRQMNLGDTANKPVSRSNNTLVWRILGCIEPSLPNIHINNRGYKHCYTFRESELVMFFIHFCEITHEKKKINHTHAHTWTSIETDKGISEIDQPWGAILVQSSQTLHYVFFYHHHVSMSLSPYHICHDAHFME
jgi:hypothetical protein